MRISIMLLAGLPAGMAASAQQEIPAASVACPDGRIVAAAQICETESVLPGPYIVFFTWGGTGLDGDAMEIVEAVAQAYAADGRALRLSLSGHSDRSGPPGVNARISRQRAIAVRDALAARGVPSSAMSIASQGEKSMLIGTEDGVREAQNRRVEIVFEIAED